MSTFTNSPRQKLVLQLEARKSFSLGIWIKDTHDIPLDISDTTLRLVSKPEPFGQDDETSVIVNRVAEMVKPEEGYARFDMQAVDLFHPAGEYPFTIVQVTNGYSSVIANGVIALRDNPEYESLNDVYEEGQPMVDLEVKLRGQQVLMVRAGQSLAPGAHSFTTAEKMKLESVEFGAQKNVGVVPPGGFPGNFLAKKSGNDHDMEWVAGAGGSGGGLSAEGVPAGYVPTANGANNWSWEEILAGVITVNGKDGVVTLTLEDIPDAVNRLAMTVAERDAIAALGTAANSAIEDFLPSTGIDTAKTISGVFNNARVPKVNQLRGISFGTAAPSPGSGQSGDIYFQYEL